MSVTITAPRGIPNPSSQGGDDTIFGLALIAATRGVKMVPKGDYYEMKGITEIEKLTIPTLTYMVSVGCEVYHLPLFFKITLTDTVPDDLKQSDEEGNLIGRTWQEYYDATPTRNYITKQDGYYAGTNVFSSSYLPVSQALSIASENSYTLIRKADLDALENISE